MQDFIAKLIKAILVDGGSIDSNWLKFGTEFGGTYSAVGIFIKNMWNYLALIGIGMTVIYFLIEINQKLAIEGAQNMTLKSFMSPFLKLAIAIVILINGANITLTLLNINDAFVNYASGQINTDETTEGESGESGGGDEDEDSETAGMTQAQADVYEDIMKEVDELGLLQAAIFCFILIIAYFFSLLISLVWMFKAITYKLEVLYRIGITPVALADVYSGSHSNAFRWLKGFLALALYAMAIIALPKLATLLGASSLAHAEGLWGLVKALFTLFVAPFAALGVASTVKQTCKEALA